MRRWQDRQVRTSGSSGGCPARTRAGSRPAHGPRPEPGLPASVSRAAGLTPAQPAGPGFGCLRGGGVSLSPGRGWRRPRFCPRPPPRALSWCFFCPVFFFSKEYFWPVEQSQSAQMCRNHYESLSCGNKIINQKCIFRSSFCLL